MTLTRKPWSRVTLRWPPLTSLLPGGAAASAANFAAAARAAARAVAALASLAADSSPGGPT